VTACDQRLEIAKIGQSVYPDESETTLFVDKCM